MEKYLGNKTVLLPSIHQFIVERAPQARSISDLFAGTTNVSRHFRKLDFNVIAGDLNRFSYVLARAYLGSSTCPSFGSIDGQYDAATLERLRFAVEGSASADRGAIWRAIRPLAKALATLHEAGLTNRRRGIICEHFTRDGKYSAFTSVRGSSGQRNYFSPPNALFLDGLLNTLWRWRRDGRITPNETFLLLSSVIEEVVITANVNGTFHDFNRTRLWPNALQPFTLRLPPLVLSPSSAEIVHGDALNAARGIEKHDVCYIDPPYNFRQYGAYYHLLNFIAAYAFLQDPDDYVQKLTFVRGQNMVDDHSSSFCFRDDFIGSLRKLILRVPANHVVLSYYGGRNHWNHWSVTDELTDRGLMEVSALFRDRTLFDDCEIIPALSIRRNYQSRAGEKKKLVNEYLLIGSRTRVPAARQAPVSELAANKAIGVVEHFPHFLTSAVQNFPRTQSDTLGPLAIS